MYLLLFIFMSLFSSGTSQQTIPNRNISMDQGLRSNTVRNIVQDKYGFIWLGTDDGLCRYDGFQVKFYSMPSVGADQYPSALFPADDGLYVGCVKGALFFDFQKETFTPIAARKIRIQVTSFCSDQDGNLWISTMGQGVFRYNKTSRQCKQFPCRSQKGSVNKVFVDHDNQVYLYSNLPSSPLLRLDKARDSFRPVAVKGHQAPYGGLSMIQTSTGDILLGSWESG